MRFGVVITITCLVLAIAAVIYLNQPVPEPSLQPSAQRVSETSSQEVTPPQTTESTDPTTDTTTEDAPAIEAKPDTHHWWDDTGDDLHEHAHTEDPWGEILSENSRDKDVAEEEVRDPMSLEALIKKFGDIPEVHTFAAGWEKSKHGIQRPTEEMIEYIEAMNYLFPNPTTERTLEMIKAANAGDLATVRRYVDIQPADPEVERLYTSIKPYFEGKDRVEGLRQLRAADPSLAAKLVRQLRHEATVDSDVSLEKVERFIRLSYESPTETQ